MLALLFRALAPGVEGDASDAVHDGALALVPRRCKDYRDHDALRAGSGHLTAYLPELRRLTAGRSVMLRRIRTHESGAL